MRLWSVNDVPVVMHARLTVFQLQYCHLILLLLSIHKQIYTTNNFTMIAQLWYDCYSLAVLHHRLIRKTKGLQYAMAYLWSAKFKLEVKGAKMQISQMSSKI